MKKRVVLFLFLFALLVSSCMNVGTKALRSDEFEKNSYNLDKFSGISVEEGIEVILYKGEEYRAEARSNFMEYLKVEVNNGILRVYFDKPSFTSFANDKTIVKVWAEDLNQFKASSAATLRVEDVFENSTQIIKVSSAGNIYYDVYAENVTIDASSAGEFEGIVGVYQLDCSASSAANIKLKGSANYANLKASSSGSIEGEQCTVDKVDAKASSSGDISIYVKQELNAKASSSGSVGYVMDKNVDLNVDTSSSGKVRKLKY